MTTPTKTKKTVPADILQVHNFLGTFLLLIPVYPAICTEFLPLQAILADLIDL